MTPQQPFTNPATTALAQAWFESETHASSPEAALRTAREGMARVGRGAPFAQALARFEVAVRADARASAYTEVARLTAEVKQLRADLEQARTVLDPDTAG